MQRLIFNRGSICIYGILGPRLFLSCPLDVESSRVWFTDLWNYSIIPYMIEAVREGVQLYGRRSEWQDPTEMVVNQFPWEKTSSNNGGHDGEWPYLMR